MVGDGFWGVALSHAVVSAPISGEDMITGHTHRSVIVEQMHNVILPDDGMYRLLGVRKDS